MDKVKACLKEWIVNYLKNRNMAFKTIENIEEKGDDVHVKYKDKKVTYYVRPYVKDFSEFSSAKDGTGIVVYNAKENFDALVNSWEKLKENKNITIYFANPFSQLDIKWIIMPYTHDRISDAASLKQGLKSMYDMVEPLPKEMAEKKIK